MPVFTRGNDPGVCGIGCPPLAGGSAVARAYPGDHPPAPGRAVAGQAGELWKSPS